MMTAGQSAAAEERSELREPVLYRARLTAANGTEQHVTLVNVSPSGFMARGDGAYAEGDAVTVLLPRLGRVAAEVRWSLGGRIGCKLNRQLGMSDYHLLLQAMPRG